MRSACASSHSRKQARTFDRLTASVADIQSAIDAGKLTYEQLVQLSLNRIDASDKKGPRLNAVIAINPKALDIARSLDQERRAKGRRSPLHGNAIAVKDTVDVKDITSAGGNIALKSLRRQVEIDRGAITFSNRNFLLPDHVTFF